MRTTRSQVGGRAVLRAAALGVLAPAVCWGQGLTVDRIAGQVNDRIITLSQVLALSRAKEAEARLLYDGERLETQIREARLDALNQLVERALIVGDFERQENLQLPEKIVDDEMRRIIEEMHGGDRNAFRESMQADGYSVEDIRTQIRERIIVQLMRQRMVTGEIFVSPRKIEQYYLDRQEEFRRPGAIHVVLVQAGEPAGGGGLAGDVLGRVRERVEAGASIEAAVDAAKDGSGLELRVRDFGWIARGYLRPELDPVAFGLDPGQSGGPVETADGWFLVFVRDRRGETIPPIDEVRQEIEERLESEERNRRHREWIESLRRRSYVRIDYP